MSVTFFNILPCIATLIFIISAFTFLTSVYVLARTRGGKRRTQKGTATLIQLTESNWRNAPRYYKIAYIYNGTEHQVTVSEKYVELNIPRNLPAGTQLPIWYDPERPDQVVISEEPFMRKTAESSRRTRKCSLILMLIFGCLAAYALPRSVTEEQSLRNMTTIGAFSDEIKALVEESPTAFIYVESIGAPETFSVTVDDPAFAKKALDVVLSAAVDKRGCQMDMARMMEEEYRFVFDGERYAFSFVPSSYFYFDGQYYELGENRLAEVRNRLHEEYAASEPAEAREAGPATEPLSKWYGDDAVLETEFLDNGDEARSLTQLTLSAGGETLTGAIEGAYDVLNVDRQPDGYVIRYTYGDFYSHNAVRSSCVTVENGEMIISDMAQQGE